MKSCKRTLSGARLLILAGVFLSLTGCASTQEPQVAAPVSPPAEAIDWQRLPMPPGEKQLVAVAGFENKSTYSADKLWDTSSQILSSYLLRSQYFRVVEWEKMKRLFDWDTLSSADLVKSPENMKKAQRILLCQYFVTGAITYFDVRQHAQVSAMSKEKVLDTTIRVDLLLQDAQTGEYLSAGKGEHTVSQTYSGGLGGGQTGSWDSRSADDALDTAIGKALFEMISGLGSGQGTGTTPTPREGFSTPGTSLNP